MATRVRYLCGLAALAAAGVCILGAGTAEAATPFGSMDAAVLKHQARLQGKVLVNIPLTVTCAPLDSTSGTLVEVDVEQGTNGLVARGSGSIPSVVCDNTAHTYKVPVLARWSDSAQLPAFHRGQAVLQASAFVCGTLAGSSGCESDTTAWQPIRFR